MDNHGNGYGTKGGHGGQFVAGLLIGGLIGSGVMLLLAPQSGKKTRRQIQEESIELRDQVTETVKDAASQVRGQAKEVMARAEKETKGLHKRGQTILDGQMDIVNRAVDGEKSAIHDMANG
jgi:gas vesicle protein